jgi:hypothetical protein
VTPFLHSSFKWHEMLEDTDWKILEALDCSSLSDFSYLINWVTLVMNLVFCVSSLSRVEILNFRSCCWRVKVMLKLCSSSTRDRSIEIHWITFIFRCLTFRECFSSYSFFGLNFHNFLLTDLHFSGSSHYGYERSVDFRNSRKEHSKDRETI